MFSKIPAQIQVIPIDPTKNQDLKTHYEILRRRHNVSSNDRPTFKDLSRKQRRNVIKFSQDAFIEKQPTKWWDFFNCMAKPKRIRHKDINLCVFEIINYLSLYIHNEVYAFRLDNKDSDVQSYVDSLARNQRINFSSLSIGKLCTILKKYILNHLNGILPMEIASYLISTAQVKNKLQYKALLSALPYALSENEADLILKIFELFRIIDRNKNRTLMTMDSCLKLFSLVLFPKESFNTLDKLELAEEITKDIFKLDFNEIPFTLVPQIVMYV